jgi:hypothetical protein
MNFNSMGTSLGNLTTEQWTAIGTFLAILVALFQERIKEFFTKAQLNMVINLSPPDCHQIMLVNAETGEYMTRSIYIRIKVDHIGGNTAENVEVMAANLWQVMNDGSKTVRKSFLPMNLIWSHFQPRRTTVRIPVGSFRHCDFGYFSPFNRETVLKLDTMVNPNFVADDELPNIIYPGIYEFELLLTADNASPVRKRWNLVFDSEWSDDESEMLSDHIHITEIN